MSTTRPASAGTSNVSRRTPSMSPVATAITIVGAFVACGILIATVPVWAFVLIAALVGAVVLFGMNRNR